MAQLISLLSNITFLTFLVVYVFAIWLGLVIWTWVDIARRTENLFYRFAMALLVAVGAFVGFAFYLMIRPSLTRREVESLVLEEQFLLSTSSFSVCSSCQEVCPEAFLFCTRCGNNLKNKCKNCASVLNKDWAACPNCGTLQKEVPLLNVIEQHAVAGLRSNFRLPKISISFSPILGLLQSLKAETKALGNPVEEIKEVNVKPRKSASKQSRKKTRLAARRA